MSGWMGQCEVYEGVVQYLLSGDFISFQVARSDCVVQAHWRVHFAFLSSSQSCAVCSSMGEVKKVLGKVAFGGKKCEIKGGGSKEETSGKRR